MIPQKPRLSRRRLLAVAAASAVAGSGLTGCSTGGGKGGRASSHA
ncbi:MAG: FeS-binding protein, partial [Streptomyces sp.]|nr:FeS-binding protein [Streptomyces sp.]